MNDFRVSEEYLSQIPALQLLVNLGYIYLPPEAALAQRQGKRSKVLLDGVLRERLKRINRIHHKGDEHLFSEENIQAAVQKLKSIPYDGLIRTNEQIHDLLMLGASFEQTVNGDTRSFSLRYIDWNTPSANAFHVTAEFPVDRTRCDESRRPDIVLFVNGIPFAVIECKASHTELEQAVSQQIRNQREDEIPRLFVFAQLLLALNKNGAKYATVGTPAKFWSLWREQEDVPQAVSESVNRSLSEEEKKALFSGEFAPARSWFDQQEAAGHREVTEQDKALFALCRPERLLDLSRRFVVFDSGVKKIARYQQFYAVRNILRRVATQRDDEGRRRGGVVWHTQGSGKSLTMVMLARALALDPDIPTPRVVLVTDRVDLDEQIKKTFRACGLEAVSATSGRHLLQLFSRKTGIVTTIIHKFKKALETAKGFTDADENLFLLIDESHRSQKEFGESMHVLMRRMLPKACFLGFTGTPLMKKERNTFRQFGGMIQPYYTVKDAVADGAVVPLLYEGRLVEQEVNTSAIDTWFERVCQGLTDAQKADLKKKYSRAEMLQKTDQTVFCRAFDISEHYRQNWQGSGYKAQLVAPDKATAIRYKKHLDELGYVISEVVISTPDTREDHEEVGEDPKGEVQSFWKKMMERFGTEETYNRQLIERFKHAEDPEILIVVDKLLTGFDAPRNTVLYITRPLRDHTLLQAIARVNRLFSDEESGAEKEFGFIIDYAGLLGELDKALTAYGALDGFEEDDIAGALTNVQAEIDRLPQRHANLWEIFKSVRASKDEEAYEQLLADETLRQEFYEALSQYAKTLGVALAADKFVLETPEHRLDTYRKDLKRFQLLRASVQLRYADTVNFKRDFEPRIRKLLDTHIAATEVTQLTKPVNIFDDDSFEKAVEDQGTPASQADLIAHATKRTISERMSEDPAFYERFSRLIQKAIDDFRNKRISELEYLKKAREVRSAVVNRTDEEIPADLQNDADARAFFGLLQPVISGHVEKDERVKDVAGEAALAIREIFHKRRIIGFESNQDAQNAMLNDLDDFLFDEVRDRHGIPLTPAEMDDLLDKLMQLARHRAAL